MGTTVLSYVNTQYHRLNSNTEASKTPLLIVCASHFISRVARKIEIKKRSTRRLFLSCMGHLQIAKTFEEAGCIWRDMVSVFSSSHLKDAETKTAWTRLDCLLKNNVSDVETDVLKTENEKVDEVTQKEDKLFKEDAKTLRKESPFTAHFKEIAIVPLVDENHTSEVYAAEALAQVSIVSIIFGLILKENFEDDCMQQN